MMTHVDMSGYGTAMLDELPHQPRLISYHPIEQVNEFYRTYTPLDSTKIILAAAPPSASLCSAATSSQPSFSSAPSG
jgi:hypothetical protein